MSGFARALDEMSDDERESLRKSSREQERSRKKRNLIINVVSFFAATSALSGGVFSIFLSKDPFPTAFFVGEGLTVSTKKRVDSLSRELELVKQDYKNVIGEFNTLKSDPKTVKGIDIARIETSVNKIENRITVLENAIVDSPEKALSIPLMKKDIDNMKITYDSRINELSQFTSGTASQIYTIVGSVTVAISIAFIAALLTIRSKS